MRKCVKSVHRVPQTSNKIRVYDIHNTTLAQCWCAVGELNTFVLQRKVIFSDILMPDSLSLTHDSPLFDPVRRFKAAESSPTAPSSRCRRRTPWRLSAGGPKKGLTWQNSTLQSVDGPFQRSYQAEDKSGLKEQPGQVCKGTLNEQRRRIVGAIFSSQWDKKEKATV